ncbi:MAG: G5 domain-containing protein [Streptococcus mitis]|nr:G5 domain-containing protein [Streptococcus mitis]
MVEEKTIDFQIQERKSDKLYLGETRILQEGRQGLRVHLIEVENGKRTEKESYDKVIAQDRIVEVGTAIKDTRSASQEQLKTAPKEASKSVLQDQEVQKPESQETTKQQASTEKTDVKQVSSRSVEAQQDEKNYLPNTGTEAEQAAVAAGLALLGLSAGLVATKGKKED